MTLLDEEVSMKSGLVGRNNYAKTGYGNILPEVSMKSGLVGRNNTEKDLSRVIRCRVSMKSGLVGRNNLGPKRAWRPMPSSLNEVRPSRPEQYYRYPFPCLRISGSQ